MSGRRSRCANGSPWRGAFSVLYYRAGRLLAVHAVNSPRDYLAVRRALAAGQEIPPELAAGSGELRVSVLS
jgi:3-phenylpropionate/trans-cinnamate dioxygenase ferredoxin reductase component